MSDFDAYRFIKNRFHDRLAEAKANPRVKCDQLAAGISLDYCLAEFFRTARQLPETEGLFTPGTPTNHREANWAPRYAEEYDIGVDNPPLIGRLDQIRNGVIVDFKTGDPDAEHAKEHELQLKFYSVLWWLRYGKTPNDLELRYSNGTVHTVVVLSESESAIEADRLRSEIAAAKKSLEDPPPLANVDKTTCQFCAVRQLCNEYWSNRDLLSLRALAVDPVATQTSYCDVRVTELPVGWKTGTHLLGQARSSEFGMIQISVPAGKCPNADQPLAVEARLLGAAVSRQDGYVLVKSAAHTEVFWVPRS